MYIDGSDANASIYNQGTPGLPTAVASSFALGVPIFTGIIDEVRISNTVRSAGWIGTSYTNQNTPDVFYRVNSEDYIGGGNQVPTVDAGSTQTITLPASANLSDASASDSDGPSSLTYTWTKQSGPGTVTFSPNNTALNPTASFSVDGTYVLKLSVYDGAGTSEDTVTITVNPAGPPAPDIDDYSCNLKITINSGQVAGDLDNFPVLISLTDDSLKTTGCGFMTDVDGDDLIFTNSSKTIQLDHEIEKYDETTGELVAWVEVPFLSGSSNTDIYMYFGNSNVTSPQNNPTGVWDSNYKGVWHLKEDAVAAAPVTLNERIIDHADDSEEYISSGGIDWGSSDLELGEEGSPQIVGMRWRNLAIPQGATITSAYIVFTADEVQEGTPVNLTFWGEDADNAAVFENVSYNISSRTKTSASVAWNNVPLWSVVGETHQSPDISPVIQEIVNRGGWASGNALVVLVTGSGRRTADSYSEPTKAPLLHVEYTTPASVHLDSTSNSNHGVPHGNSYTASGKIDGAQDFDGVDDYVELPDLITSTTGTISLWVRPSSMVSHTIFDASSGSKYFYIDINSSSLLRANLEDSADADFNTSYDVSSLSPYQWYYLTFAWRFGSSPVIRLYRDGNLVDQNT
jgi:hypothetical protein